MGRHGPALLLDAAVGLAGTANDQLFQVQQVLGLEFLAGPMTGGLQFDAHEIPDFAINTVTDGAGKGVAGAMHVYDGADGERDLKLQTHAGGGDILQESLGFVFAAAWPFPPDVHQVGAEHADFSPL